MRIWLVALLAAIAGCAEHGRYQMVQSGNSVWRLDTRTGSLEACGFESAKPACHLFPPPASTK
jgi:hypothetical protein